MKKITIFMNRKNQKFKLSLGALSIITLVLFFIPFGENENFSGVEGLLELFAFASDPKTHYIEMSAENHLNGTLAYKMLSHEIEDSMANIENVTATRYGNNTSPSIPGPAIVIDEGDEVFLTLHNNLGSDCVSVHTHGVHYFIEDDGTLQITNQVEDSCATPSTPKTYHWTAAKGTAGTWPYHDHTFEQEIGAEDRGLFGVLIVNQPRVKTFFDGSFRSSVATSDIDKEYVLYMVRFQFWGLEIDNKNGGLQTPLQVNPTLVAKQNDEVRFHVIGLGTEFHTFHLHAHRWLDQGTTDVIDTKTIGPLARHVFVIKAGEGVGSGDWMYHCHVFRHMEFGMSGIFKVTAGGGPSIPGPHNPI